ncbi:MAG: plasmid stabilization protein [Alkaliphilus sp.]|nr:type II toxin-antitoxin system RelE/ParE family toxin [Alkaliphilus sp. AH-315-G20]MBN4067614.1 type II toxin-antitoxin system RelE/ParE family toxin [Alkaliphilus transvaalensis]PHS35974.1 MAG: plasmid stabilization protein [Alkaliphilus sp.]
MYEIRFMRVAEKYLKKLKDKNLKNAFKSTFVEISINPYKGKLKVGDLVKIFCYDMYYNKTNYETAYRVNDIFDSCNYSLNIHLKNS